MRADRVGKDDRKIGSLILDEADPEVIRQVEIEFLFKRYAWTGQQCTPKQRIDAGPTHDVGNDPFSILFRHRVGRSGFGRPGVGTPAFGGCGVGRGGIRRHRDPVVSDDSGQLLSGPSEMQEAG